MIGRDGRTAIAHMRKAAAANADSGRSIRTFGSSKTRSARGSNRHGTTQAARMQAAIARRAAASARGSS